MKKISKGKYSKKYNASSLKVMDQATVVGIAVFANCFWVGLFWKITWLLWIGLAFAVPTVVVALMAWSSRQMEVVQVTLEPLKDRVDTWTSDYLALPSVGQKHLWEILVFVFLLFLTLGLLGVPAIYFGQNALLTSDPKNYVFPGLLSVFCLGLSMLCLRQISASLRELNLCKMTAGREVMLSQGLLSISIGLLEGKMREQMRETSSPYFKLDLSKVKECIVDPVKTRRIGRRANFVPAYYVFQTDEAGQKIFVLRKYFAGFEEQFISRLRAELQISIILNDELV